MDLFKHQDEAAEFLIRVMRAILVDQMGLGKTRSAIVATQRTGGDTLVLCPASLKTNWAREIIMVDSEATISIMSGTKIEQYSVGRGQFYLIANYDVIHKPQNELFIRTYEFDTAILDEAHYIKSSKSKRSQAAIDLVAGKIKRVYLLTGTPILNRPEELFMLLKAISHPLGQNWHTFVMRYCGAFWQEAGQKFNRQTGRWEKRRFLNVSGATNLQELHEKLKPVYLRRTKEILRDALSAKIITNIPVELSKEARKEYASAWDKYMDYLDNNPIIFSDLTDAERQEKIDNIVMTKHLVELQKLKQVVSQAKIGKVCEDVQEFVENGEKVIIFTQYTDTLQKIRTALTSAGIGTVSLSGEDNQLQRQLAIDGFQKDDGIKVFVGNIKAAGVGITLTAASTVVFADMEYTPALHEQAEDRAHRIGQNKQVNIYYYIAQKTIEEDIVELLERKSQTIKKILEGETKRVGQVNIAAQLIKKLSTSNKK